MSAAPIAELLGPPLRGSRWLHAFGTGTLRLLGWRIVGSLPPLPRFVAVVAPHTSNWDFPLGVVVMFALDIRVHWLGKDTLFRGPFGMFLRALGGRPVHRETHEGVVRDVVQMVHAEPRMVIALAPEGTRRRVTHWRTGFYHIAEGAGIPIVPVWFDWRHKEIGIGAPFAPTGDAVADIEALQRHYRADMALRPESFWTTEPA